VSVTTAASVFVVIFLAELPDKTMFSSLVMASRGRPLAVWLGAAAAFVVHVVIAVSVGVALFKVLPQRAVDALVAGMFFASSLYSFLIRNRGAKSEDVMDSRTTARIAISAAGVVFIAEWGDLTQILTANLTVHYRSALSVGIGALGALWVVAAIAVTAGSQLLRVLSVRTLRLVTAVVLLVLAVYSTVLAVQAR